MLKHLARQVIIVTFLLTPFSGAALSDDSITSITWEDLWAEEGLEVEGFDSLNFRPTGSLPSNFFQPPVSYLTTKYNNKKVRLDGFMLPLKLDSEGVSTFLLVPYVGACIHVPPPPPNQLVLVQTASPYQSDDMFAPVTVTGVFHTEMTSTELADVGYTIQAEEIDIFDDW